MNMTEHGISPDTLKAAVTYFTSLFRRFRRHCRRYSYAADARRQPERHLLITSFMSRFASI